MKAVGFHDGCRNRPTLDNPNLGFINLDSLTGDNIPKEDNLRSIELTLLKLSIKSLLPQDLEHLSEVFLMRCLILAIHQDIIKVYHNKLPNE